MRERKLSDPPPRQMLRPSQLDDVGQALIAVTRELWVLTDRLAVLEGILEAKGVLVEEEVDRFQPSPALLDKLTEQRERLIRLVESTLRGEV